MGKIVQTEFWERIIQTKLPKLSKHNDITKFLRDCLLERESTVSRWRKGRERSDRTLDRQIMTPDDGKKDFTGNGLPDHRMSRDTDHHGTMERHTSRNSTDHNKASPAIYGQNDVTGKVTRHAAAIWNHSSSEAVVSPTLCLWLHQPVYRLPQTYTNFTSLTIPVYWSP